MSNNRKVAILGIIIFIIMTILLLTDNYESFDNIGIYLKDNFNNDKLFNFLLAVTNIMSVIGISIISIFIFFFLYKKKSIKEIYLYIIAVGSGLLINNIIKLLVRRDRPDLPLVNEISYSFPSSHACMSVIIYGFIIILIRKYAKNNKVKNISIILLLLLIFLTMISRIYLNVHYLTDVCAGFGVGIVILTIINYYYKKINN